MHTRRLRRPSFVLSLFVLSLLFAAVALLGCGRDEMALACVGEEIRSDLERRDLSAEAAWRDREWQGRELAQARQQGRAPGRGRRPSTRGSSSSTGGS